MLWNGLATKQKSIHSNWSGLTKRWPLLSDTSSNHKIVRQRETWARDAAQAFAKGNAAAGLKMYADRGPA
jgi:hypothetical protein